MTVMCMFVMVFFVAFLATLFTIVAFFSTLFTALFADLLLWTGHCDWWYVVMC